MGWSQAEISKELQLHPSTISLDCQYLREQAQKELQTHIQEGIPLEYLRARTGLNNVLKRVSEILEQATDTKTKLECMKLLMDLYRSIMNLASDGSVIERAMKTIKIISPLPSEDIPAKSEEDKEIKEVSSESDETLEQEDPKEE
jgi:hypothetical protein